MLAPWLIMVVLGLGTAKEIPPELHKVAQQAVDYLKNAHNNYKDMTIDQATKHVWDKLKVAAARAHPADMTPKKFMDLVKSQLGRYEHNQHHKDAKPTSAS